jgi:hypothetical protein
MNSKDEFNLSNNLNQKTKLHDCEMLEITNNLINNSKKLYGGNFNYEKNLEYHIHNNLANLLTNDSKLKTNSKLNSKFTSKLTSFFNILFLKKLMN